MEHRLETAIDRHSLALDTPFEIARGEAATDVDVHVCRVSDQDGTTGFGVAAPSDYYGETPATVEAALPTLLNTLTDVEPVQRVERVLADHRGEPAARAAVSIAAHDLATRRIGIPLYRRFGLDPTAAPPTTVTIGLDDPDAMAQRAEAAVTAGFDHLKVKLGTGADRERFSAVREVAPDATIRVDANGAWSPSQAIEACEWLADGGVAFLEQPVAGDDLTGLGRVQAEGSLPIAVDESCPTASEVPAIAGVADIVVVKLMKCGGIAGALKQIAAAHADGLEVMLGCMVEPNPSIAAACHLAPLVEYADLDGSLLLADDPYEGVPIVAGDIRLEDVSRSGTGVVPK